MPARFGSDPTPIDIRECPMLEDPFTDPGSPAPDRSTERSTRAGPEASTTAPLQWILHQTREVTASAGPSFDATTQPLVRPGDEFQAGQSRVAQA